MRERGGERLGRIAWIQHHYTWTAPKSRSEQVQRVSPAAAQPQKRHSICKHFPCCL